MSEKIIYDDIDGKSHDVTDMIHALGYVRVVRCKDCKFNKGHNKCLNEHSIIDIPRDNDYCSYGERKEQEHDITTKDKRF